MLVAGLAVAQAGHGVNRQRERLPAALPRSGKIKARGITSATTYGQGWEEVSVLFCNRLIYAALRRTRRPRVDGGMPLL